MRVVSLFDGISCAKVALDKAGIPITSYKAYEIENNAITISRANHPNIQHCGDVKNLIQPEAIDILIGGSPCQDLSIAKKQRLGLAGERSNLFWEFVRIKDLCNPRFFILENVASMPQRDKETITATLGVQPILIDAALVSAQSRQRLFWTNIPVVQPEDRGITIQSVLESNPAPEYRIQKTAPAVTQPTIGRDIGRRLTAEGIRADHNRDIPITRRIELRNDNKCGTITKVLKDNLVITPNFVRRLTPIEVERLFGLPDNYTEGVSETQRYKTLANAFHTEVIAHILRFIQF